MEYANRIGRIYGYLVCLATIAVFFASTASVVGALYDRANPLRTEYGGPALTSFQAYKATHGNLNPARDKASTTPDTLSDAALQEQYSARVADRIATVRYQTAKTIGTQSFLVLLAIGLFLTHWRWVRRLSARAAAA